MDQRDSGRRKAGLESIADTLRNCFDYRTSAQAAARALLKRQQRRTGAKVRFSDCFGSILDPERTPAASQANDGFAAGADFGDLT